MVDVDETYREPLFGEAFYHEKALTTTRVMDEFSFYIHTHTHMSKILSFDFLRKARNI